MLQWSERLLVNLQHQVQYDYNVTAQKTNSTSYAYGLTLAWNSIQTHVRPLFLSHDSLTSVLSFQRSECQLSSLISCQVQEAQLPQR